jgi:copper chaperone CopZ
LLAAWESSIIRKRGALLLVLVATGGVSGARAGVEEVRLQVEGMQCSLCGTAVERKLSSLRSVESVEVDPESGKVVVRGRPGGSLELRGIREQIVRAGYRPAPDHEEIRAVGTVNHGLHDRLFFRIEETKESFDLLENAELRRLLESLPATGMPRVSVSGRVNRQPDDLPPTLTVLDYTLESKP